MLRFGGAFCPIPLVGCALKTSLGKKQKEASVVTSLGNYKVPMKFKRKPVRS